MEFALLAQSGAPGGAGCVQNLVPLALIIIIIWFLIIRPERQKQQEHQDFLEKLKVGDDVVTAGGLFGEVTSIDDDTVKLRVSRESEVEVLRDQIKGPQSDYLGDDEDEDEEDDEESSSGFW